MNYLDMFSRGSQKGLKYLWCIYQAPLAFHVVSSQSFPLGTDTMILRYEAHLQPGTEVRQEQTELRKQSHFLTLKAVKNK